MDLGGRVFIIDFLRGLAVVFMFCHFPGPWMDWGSGLHLLSFLLSRLAAPLFFILAGYSIHLSGEKRIACAGRSGFLGHVFSRLLIFLAAGELVKYFNGEEGLIVIQQIGLSVFLLGIVYVTRLKAALPIVLAASIIPGILQEPVEAAPHMDKPLSLIIYLFTGGEYPPAYWLSYYLLGLGLAMHGGLSRLEGKSFNLGWLAIASSIFLALAIPIDMAYNSLSFMAFIVGFLLMSHGLSLLFCRKYGSSFPAGVLATLGRHALPTFILLRILVYPQPAFPGFPMLGTLNPFASLALTTTAIYTAIRIYERIRGIQPRYKTTG